jgi:hypothetical protein
VAEQLASFIAAMAINLRRWEEDTRTARAEGFLDLEIATQRWIDEAKALIKALCNDKLHHASRPSKLSSGTLLGHDCHAATILSGRHIRQI